MEVRKGDKADGPLMKAWLQDGSLIDHPYSEDWAAVLDLSKKGDCNAHPCTGSNFYAGSDKYAGVCTPNVFWEQEDFDKSSRRE